MEHMNHQNKNYEKITLCMPKWLFNTLYVQVIVSVEEMVINYLRHINSSVDIGVITDSIVLIGYL